MFYICSTRFDVIVNFKKFLGFGELNMAQGAKMAGCAEKSNEAANRINVVHMCLETTKLNSCRI
jgi:hypothetical protein